MSYVAKIIAVFGGVRPMARTIGQPVSTVQSWKDRESIPDECKVEVLLCANRLGLGIVREDFFPTLPEDQQGAA
ncbi:MAG TPA: hypothetical protein DC061_16995 [Gemmobacter sp.]|nr:MAG: hypothetical protein A2X69_16735 [Rhodobacteraceae bacterium GWF1_65_7]HBD92131.1 hypothetical protein [Gemmobacter sp.]